MSTCSYRQNNEVGALGSGLENMVARVGEVGVLVSCDMELDEGEFAGGCVGRSGHFGVERWAMDVEWRWGSPRLSEQ